MSHTLRNKRNLPAAAKRERAETVEDVHHIDGNRYTQTEFRAMMIRREDIPQWLKDRWETRWAAEGRR